MPSPQISLVYFQSLNKVAISVSHPSLSILWVHPSWSALYVVSCVFHCSLAALARVCQSALTSTEVTHLLAALSNRHRIVAFHLITGAQGGNLLESPS